MNRPLLALINNSNNIALFSHVHPDADALGALSALSQVLINQGKNVVICMETLPPKNFRFLDFSGQIILNSKRKHKLENKGFTESNTLFLTLDTAHKSLLGQFEKYFSFSGITACIDHHLTHKKFTRYDYVDYTKSSTCELLLDFFLYAGYKITSSIATSLYFGIVGDTGRFLHSNTTADTFRAAASLKEFGADIVAVNEALFKAVSMNSLKMQKILLRNLKIQKGVAISYITIDDCLKEHMPPVTSCDQINMLISVEGVNIAIVIIEVAWGIYNLSFRSREQYDVAKLALRYGGGGHLHASGAKNINGRIKNLKNSIFSHVLKNQEFYEIKCYHQEVSLETINLDIGEITDD